MQVVNYTKARNNLRKLIDAAVDHDEEIIITTRDEKTVVMISLDQYNLTHAQIRRDVKEAFEDIAKGRLLSVDEAFEDVMRAIAKKA
ncbi:MAG: type II toxin-antitoxin system Phd/YefM family antitoxin [Epsilonproteobacteria bacterium]|nr:type II toxin-antitoxin system Phd/YefM family antitoxin [Campylobacterota bacterium]